MSAILTAEQEKTLRKFNAAVDELMELPFVKDISQKKHSQKITFTFPVVGDPHSIVTVETEGHDPNNVRSAATIVRLFTYDGRERLSLQQIAKIYDDASIDAVYKKRIVDIRKAVNDHLQDNAELFLRAPLTNDTIMRTIFYGMLVHRDDTKEATILQWKKDEAEWQEIWHAFEKTMNFLTGIMKIIKENNALILKTWGSKST